ncbi:unnamed protein product [Closterium sp. NIES-54]
MPACAKYHQAFILAPSSLPVCLVFTLLSSFSLPSRHIPSPPLCSSPSPSHLPPRSPQLSLPPLPPCQFLPSGASSAIRLLPSGHSSHLILHPPISSRPAEHPSVSPFPNPPLFSPAPPVNIIPIVITQTLHHLPFPPNFPNTPPPPPPKSIHQGHRLQRG